jgi:uncharacterized membrane protein
MNSALALALAFSIGVVAGLRSLTAPAVVAWAAHLGWINLHGTPLSFVGSVWAVTIFTLLALAELVADQFPKTPSRTTPVGLSARIVTGALTGACLAVAGGVTPWLGALAGPLGGIAGAFRRLSRTCRTGPRLARSGFCNRNPGGPNCNRAWIVSGFAILKQPIRRFP